MAIVKKLLYITVILSCSSSQLFAMNVNNNVNNSQQNIQNQAGESNPLPVPGNLPNNSITTNMHATPPDPILEDAFDVINDAQIQNKFNELGFTVQSTNCILKYMSKMRIKGQEQVLKILGTLASFNLPAWRIRLILQYMSEIEIKGEDQVSGILKKFDELGYDKLLIQPILGTVYSVGILGQDQILEILDEFNKQGFSQDQTQTILSSMSKLQIQGEAQIFETLDKFNKLGFTVQSTNCILKYMPKMKIKDKGHVFALLNKFTELQLEQYFCVEILECMSEIGIKGEDQVFGILDTLHNFTAQQIIKMLHHIKKFKINDLKALADIIHTLEDRKFTSAQITDAVELFYQCEIKEQKDIFTILGILNYKEATPAQILDILDFMRYYGIRGLGQISNTLFDFKSKGWTPKQIIDVWKAMMFVDIVNYKKICDTLSQLENKGFKNPEQIVDVLQYIGIIRLSKVETVEILNHLELNTNQVKYILSKLDELQPNKFDNLLIMCIHIMKSIALSTNQFNTMQLFLFMLRALKINTDKNFDMYSTYAYNFLSTLNDYAIKSPQKKMQRLVNVTKHMQLCALGVTNNAKSDEVKKLFALVNKKSQGNGGIPCLAEHFVVLDPLLLDTLLRLGFNNIGNTIDLFIQLQRLKINSKESIINIFTNKIFNEVQTKDILNFLTACNMLGANGEEDISRILKYFTTINSDTIGIMRSLAGIGIRVINGQEILNKFNNLKFNPKQTREILQHMSKIKIQGKEQVFQILEKFTKLGFDNEQIIKTLENISKNGIEGVEQVLYVLNNMNKDTTKYKP